MGKCLMPQVFVIGGGDELPTDGKTWVGLKITTVTTLDTTLYYNKSDGSTLSIDWGDGSAVETDTASGNRNKSHTYSTAGSYIVKMWISVGSGTYTFGNGSSSTSFVGGSAQTDRDALQWVHIGDSVTNIGNYAFYGCYSLTSITIPNGVTYFGTQPFQNCYSLTNITIPSGVAAIFSNAFNSCHSLKTYILERTAGVTTLSNTNAFTNINSSTKIYVPDALVNDYKSAANWSTYADYIYPISEKGVTHDD